MAGSAMKISVDVTQFKQGMQQAQQSAKTLQAQMKANEAQFKATGDKEQYLTEKGKLLKAQLEEQRKAADNAKKALAAMDREGVEPTSQEYQKMEQALAGANAAMYETQAAMNSVTVSEGKAAGGAGNLEKSLSSIGKNVSLGNIVSGLDKITDGLKAAAGKAVDLGKTIFNEVKNAAKWADDAATMAEIYEIPLDKYLRMQQLVGNGMDTTVENMLGAMDKMSTSMGKESEAAKEALRSVHLMRTETDAMGNSWEILEESDPEKLFWAFGKALQDMPEGFDKNAAATAVFGKSWRELNSLFKNYGSLEEYNEALNGLTVNSEDAVTKMAELNDRLSTLETSWNTAKLEVLSAIAPALSDAATALADLLNRVTEYLKTDEGQEKLKKMEEAVSKLFGELKNIDPEDVVNKFAGVLEKITEAFTWVADHWEDVKTGLEAIGIAFGTIKIASFATNIAKVVEGFTTLWNGAHKPLPQIPGTDSGTPTTTTTTSGSGVGGLLKTVGKGLLFAAQTAEGAAMALSPALAVGLAVYGAKRDYDNIVRKGEERMAKVNEESQYFTSQTDPMLTAAWNLMGEMRRDDLPENEKNAAWIAKVGKMFEDSHSSTANTDPTLLYLESLIDQGRLNEDLYDRFDYAVRDLWKNGSDADVTFLDFQELFQQFEDELARIAAEDAAQIPVTPTVEDPAAANQAISAEIGAVPVPIVPVMGGFTRKGEEPAGFANGIWSVPWDGYPAILHKGERVTPAREIGSRSYNSNLYVESMYMNNGTDAAGLAAAMAAAQRRTMSGYGS